MVEAEHLENVHSAIHAGDDGKVALGCQGEASVSEVLDKTSVIEDKFLGVWGKVGGGRHGYILPEQVAFLHI